MTPFFVVRQQHVIKRFTFFALSKRFYLVPQPLMAAKPNWKRRFHSQLVAAPNLPIWRGELNFAVYNKAGNNRRQKIPPLAYGKVCSVRLSSCSCSAGWRERKMAPNWLLLTEKEVTAGCCSPIFLGTRPITRGVRLTRHLGGGDEERKMHSRGRRAHK